MALHKITGHEDLRKDTKSGAILLSDHAKADQYMAKKRHAEKEMQMASEINTIKKDFENVKSEISDIKALLLQIANNSGKQ